MCEVPGGAEHNGRHDEKLSRPTARGGAAEPIQQPSRRYRVAETQSHSCGRHRASAATLKGEHDGGPAQSLPPRPRAERGLSRNALGAAASVLGREAVKAAAKSKPCQKLLFC